MPYQVCDVSECVDTLASVYFIYYIVAAIVENDLTLRDEHVSLLEVNAIQTKTVYMNIVVSEPA